MNTDTKSFSLPALTSDLLNRGEFLVDNQFAIIWNDIGMKILINRAGFNKRSGAASSHLVYCLLLWVWLKVDSVAMFARESLQTFSGVGKDALYEAMNREDWDWRALHLSVAKKTIASLKATDSPRAFVLDDSIQTRYGKKMPGVSSHFDHTLGRHVMGQQVLMLGMSQSSGFVPVDSELFISQTKALALNEPFNDGRSIVAKRYRVAQQQSKPQMARAMINRAQRAGINADYLLADAWFGTKPMIRTALDAELTPLLRMKKSTMKYRLTQSCQGVQKMQDLDVQALYQTCIRCRWERIKGQPYQAKPLDVELNLNDSTDKETQWIKVRLLFVRGLGADEKQQAGKNDFAVFLTTDITLEPQQMLEIYALRWSIEVYFKEGKQYLGFLKEQSNHYAAYVASIHLTAIRFCMLVIAKAQFLCDGFAQVRNELTANINAIDYAARLWGFFRALIAGALDEMKALLGDVVNQVMETIERHVEGFFVQALQLDSRTLRLEAT
jgi:SRSO17 transposase